MNRKNAQKTQRYKSKHLSKHLIWHHCIITVSHISTHKGCRPIFHRNYSSIHSIQQGNQKLQWLERKKRIKLQSEHIDSFSLLPLLSSLQNQPSLANLLSSLSLSISSTGSTITDGRRGGERTTAPDASIAVPLLSTLSLWRSLYRFYWISLRPHGCPCERTRGRKRKCNHHTPHTTDVHNDVCAITADSLPAICCLQSGWCMSCRPSSCIWLNKVFFLLLLFKTGFSCRLRQGISDSSLGCRSVKIRTIIHSSAWVP